METSVHNVGGRRRKERIEQSLAERDVIAFASPETMPMLLPLGASRLRRTRRYCCDAAPDRDLLGNSFWALNEAGGEGCS